MGLEGNTHGLHQEGCYSALCPPPTRRQQHPWGFSFLPCFFRYPRRAKSWAGRLECCGPNSSRQNPPVVAWMRVSATRTLDTLDLSVVQRGCGRVQRLLWLDLPAFHLFREAGASHLHTVNTVPPRQKRKNRQQKEAREFPAVSQSKRVPGIVTCSL